MSDKKNKEYIDDVEGIGFGWASPCGGCVFAKYEGDTQTGCDFGRLETFKKRGIDIIPAFDLKKEFFVVKTFCNARREAEWAEGHEEQECKDQVRKEYEISMSAIVIIGDGKNDESKKAQVDQEWIDQTMEELEETLTAIRDQTIAPKIVIIVNNCYLPHFDAYHKAHEVFFDSDALEKGENPAPIKFYITQMNEGADVNLCMDESFSNVVNGYYCVFQSGHKVDRSFIERVNFIINEELEKIPYLTGYDGINGTVVNAALHKYLHGNVGVPLLQKITEISEEDESQFMVRSWEEFDESS
jgi:hypothetical protein